MTIQKALIGNQLFGIYLIDHNEMNANGFNIYFLPFMISCITISVVNRKIQEISIGVVGITFSFCITHPWFEKNN